MRKCVNCRPSPSPSTATSTNSGESSCPPTQEVYILGYIGFIIYRVNMYMSLSLSLSLSLSIYIYIYLYNIYIVYIWRVYIHPQSISI